MSASALRIATKRTCGRRAPFSEVGTLAVPVSTHAARHREIDAGREGVCADPAIPLRPWPWSIFPVQGLRSAVVIELASDVIVNAGLGGCRCLRLGGGGGEDLVRSRWNHRPWETVDRRHCRIWRRKWWPSSDHVLPGWDRWDPRREDGHQDQERSEGCSEHLAELGVPPGGTHCRRVWWQR